METGIAADVFQFGQFRLDRRKGGLFRQDNDGILRPVDIGSRARDILAVLLEHHGELVEKDAIMAAAWPDVVVTDANLTVHISSLRRVLGAGEAGASWIQTVAGRGYRFVGGVARLASPVPHVVAMPREATDIRPPAKMRPRWWVGRVAPLQAFSRLFNKAVAGERQVVFITGEAGIGKTTLVDMASEQASSQGFGILSGHCAEVFGAEEAFLPLIDALTEACRGPDRDRVLQPLRHHAPTWLVQIPGLLDTRDRAAVQAEIFGATRERMLREFCDFVEALSAERPWLLILDDLHWSDTATLNVLSRFARGERRAAVMLLASYRPTHRIDAERSVATLHRDLQLRGQATELALDRLSEGEVEQYLRRRFGNTELAAALGRRVFERTQGQPLFVTSLVDYFVDRDIIAERGGEWHVAAIDALRHEGIPDNLRTMITRQVDQLAADEQRLLEIASAAGPEFSGALVAAGTGGDLIEIERIFERLSRQGHIVAAAGTSEWPDGTFSGLYSFQHALYQEVLYQRLPPAQRVQAHRRLGDRLEDAYGAAAAEIAPILAVHFQQGREFARAVAYFGKAAESSSKRLANAEAVNYLTRALALVPRLVEPQQLLARISLLRQRGWIRRTLGDLLGSLEDLNAIIACAVEVDDRRLEVNSLLALSRFCLHADRRLCLEAADRAVARSRDIDDPALQFLAQATSASTNLYLKGWREQDAEICRQAMQITAGAREHGTLIRRYGIEGILECSRSNYLACRVAASQGKALARQAGDVYTFVLFNVMEATALLHLGEWRELQRETAAARALAERNANRPAIALCQLTMAWLHVEALDFDGARARCETIEDRVFEGNPFPFYFQRAVLAKALVGLGEYEKAAEQFRAVDHRLRADGGDLDFTIYTPLCYCRAEHALATGDKGQARAQATLLYEYALPAPDRNHLALAYLMRARIAAAEGDVAEAEAQLSCAAATLGAMPPPLAAWRVYRMAAEFYAGYGRDLEAAGYRDRLVTTIQTLAANFDAASPLQATLLGVLEGTFPHLPR